MLCFDIFSEWGLGFGIVTAIVIVIIAIVVVMAGCGEYGDNFLRTPYLAKVYGVRRWIDKLRI